MKAGDASSSWVEHAYLARAVLLALAIWACSPFFVATTYAFPGLTDSQTHVPPSSGPYAYQTFTPDDAGFLDLGESYLEPIFQTIITRVSNVYPSTGSVILYGINGLWNADSSLYMQNNGASVDLIDPDNGAIVVAQIPYPVTTMDAVSFDPTNPDVYYYTNGTKLMQYRVSTRSASVLKTFSATLGGLGNSADWISANGRWFLLNIGGQLRVWDRLRNTLYSGYAPLTGIPPGWAGISPDGNYIILSLNPQHYSYKLDHINKRVASQGVMFWDAAYDHGSVVTASNGKTYFVTDGYRYEPNGVYRVDVTLNQAGKGYAQLTSNVYLFNRGYHQAGHFSCASRGVHQDWCFLSNSRRPVKASIHQASLLVFS